MGMGPVPATRKLCARLGWRMRDIDVIETQRGVRQPGAGVLARARASPTTRRTSIPTAARSRSAIPWACPAPESAARRRSSCSSAASGGRWRRCASASARASRSRSRQPNKERQRHRPCGKMPPGPARALKLRASVALPPHYGKQPSGRFSSEGKRRGANREQSLDLDAARDRRRGRGHHGDRPSVLRPARRVCGRPGPPGCSASPARPHSVP